MLHATGHARMVKTRTEKSCPNFQFRVARARARLHLTGDARPRFFARGARATRLTGDARLEFLRARGPVGYQPTSDAREAMTVGCKPTRIHLTRSVA